MPSSRIKDLFSRLGAVIVTGGSSGIGKEFILTCSQIRRDLWFGNLSRSAPDINIPDIALKHFQCDLSKPGEIETTIPLIERSLAEEAPGGQVLLINNSGFGSFGPFDRQALASQTSMIDVNVKAPVELTHRLLPVLKERGGAVINVSSTASYQPIPYMATYGASKAFLTSWSTALHEELKPHGVGVTCLCPGVTRTPFFKASGLAENEAPSEKVPAQTPAQVVRAALRAVANRRTLVISGWGNRLLAMLANKLPRAWSARAASRMVRSLGYAEMGAKSAPGDGAPS